MKINLTELKRRVGMAYAALSFCKLCPRNCGVNRLKNELGVCHIGKIAKVASHNIHTGEEPPISGTKGSGTIFFSSCNLKCKFCQNYPVSQMSAGESTSPQKLAEMMLSLEERGCHNINIVTGPHVVPQFLAGLFIARNRGHTLNSELSVCPIIWNSGGYDGMESLRLLDGVVDIYMPDIKYSSNGVAEHYSAATNYWDIVRPVIKEMRRQVGDLQITPPFSKGGKGGLGIARRGLIIRHLVLPGNLSGTEEVLKFIAEEISPKTHISFMSQYFPAHKAVNDPIIHRRLTREEYDSACSLLERYGLENGWIQPY